MTWVNFRNDVEADVEALVTDLEGSPLAQALEASYKAALAELSAIGPQALETAVTTVATAALGALSGGTDAAIAAAVAAAPAAFEAAGKTVTSTTIGTLASSVVTQLQATQTAATPAA